MDTAQIALIVGIVSLIATIVFAILNYRTAKRTGDRATSAEARSVERSDVVWEASLTNAGYLVLRNAGSDSAHKVRVKFWIMTHREPDHPGPMPFLLRSDNAWDLQKYAGIYSHNKVKALMAPGQAVGLPIPPSILQSPFGCAATGESFGLRLQLEWFTVHGNHKTENMVGEDIGVVFSGYVFPDINTLPAEYYSTVDEAVDPELTPEELPRA